MKVKVYPNSVDILKKSPKLTKPNGVGALSY